MLPGRSNRSLPPAERYDLHPLSSSPCSPSPAPHGLASMVGTPATRSFELRPMPRSKSDDAMVSPPRPDPVEHFEPSSTRSGNGAESSTGDSGRAKPQPFSLGLPSFNLGKFVMPSKGDLFGQGTFLGGNISGGLQVSISCRNSRHSLMYYSERRHQRRTRSSRRWFQGMYCMRTGANFNRFPRVLLSPRKTSICLKLWKKSRAMPRVPRCVALHACAVNQILTWFLD